MFFVYLLASRPHGTLYVGTTDNLLRRVWEHKTKSVSGFTAKYGVDRLVWFEAHETLESALVQAKRIKGDVSARHQCRNFGVSVQEMVAGSVEVIIGVSCDPQLGPALLFGSGGVMVEVYNDVALRRCPIARSEAQAMIAEVKGARLLRGFRGRPAADIEALADTLVRASHLAMHLEGDLAELDINPLMVLPSGQEVKAVDALVVFRGP